MPCNMQQKCNNKYYVGLKMLWVRWVLPPNKKPKSVNYLQVDMKIRSTDVCKIWVETYPQSKAPEKYLLEAEGVLGSWTTVSIIP